MSEQDWGTVPERVARGAALLDEKDPGWALRLPRLSRLAIYSGSNCVFGQLYGWVWDGPGRVGIRVKEMEWYGFAEWRRSHMREVTEEWRRVVRERRLQEPVTDAAPGEGGG